jgi:CARDB
VPTIDRRRLNRGLLVAIGSLLMPRIARGAQRRADLVITALQWSDDDGLTWHNASVPAQSNLLFRAKVKNNGTAAFPRPKPIRVDFRVNGSLVAWSDTYRSGLSAGASKLLVANTGPDGDAVWYDAPAGTHKVVAHVDPLKSYTELKESNNTRSATLTVDPLPNSPEVSADLPFFGQYYGAAGFGYIVGHTSPNATPVSFFFWAQRTGTISRFRYQRRTGTGYSEGDGGTYTVSIYPADPVTKRCVPGSSAISQLTGLDRHARRDDAGLVQVCEADEPAIKETILNDKILSCSGFRWLRISNSVWPHPPSSTRSRRGAIDPRHFRASSVRRRSLSSQLARPVRTRW